MIQFSGFSSSLDKHDIITSAEIIFSNLTSTLSLYYPQV